MYLVSAYFDESSERWLAKLTRRVAEQTGNLFMTEHQVPPHITLAAFETREPEDILYAFRDFSTARGGFNLQIVSPGALLPYVIYTTPVLNEELLKLHLEVNVFLERFPDTKVNQFYKPYSWLPHITMGKTLDEEQMHQAFRVLQKYFVPFEAKVCRIGFSKTNPHEDLAVYSLL